MFLVYVCISCKFVDFHVKFFALQWLKCDHAVLWVRKFTCNTCSSGNCKYIAANSHLGDDIIKMKEYWLKKGTRMANVWTFYRPKA